MGQALINFNLFPVEDFKFKNSIGYEIEYMISENETRVYKNLFWQKDWNLDVDGDDFVQSNKEGKITSNTTRYKIYSEFLQVHDSGKRELHILDFSRIIRITIITLNASSADTVSEGTKSLEPLKEENLDISFSKN